MFFIILFNFYFLQKFMAITRSKKKEILDKLTDVVKSKAMVLVSFKGLPVSTATELRRSLTAQGTRYLVVKKTLLKKAFSTSGINGSLPDLPGETAIAYGEDALVGAKGIYEFEKKTLGQIKIVGGVYEGNYADAAMMTSLAQVPSREVLYGQFVNIINSPIAGLVMALDAIAKKSAQGGSA